MAEARGLVLVTGAGGAVASAVRPSLREAGLPVRLTDRAPVRSLLENETFVRGRLESERDMRRACHGVSALLHLGAVSTEQSWEALSRSNLQGLVTCFEAARAAGLRRLVLGSSMHCLGMHSRSEAIDETSAPAPDTRYAATKLFGEAVCRLFAAKHHMSVTVLRIGHMVDDLAQAAPGQGVASADVGRMILLALALEEPGFRLLHAVAPHPDYPLSDGRLQAEHGFHFTQQGPDRATVLARLADDPRLSPRARQLHGGDFVDAE